MIKETYNKFKAIIKGVSDDATKDLLIDCHAANCWGNEFSFAASLRESDLKNRRAC